MKRTLENVVTLVLVVCALVVTVAVVRKEFTARGGSPTADEPREINGWRDLTSAGIWLGSRDAPVVIVEFADFQCPFCAVAARSLRELRSRVDEVAILYRHFPLDAIHPHATDAAIAAECAAAQGMFEAYHDLLFAEQRAIGSIEWTDFGERAGVPSDVRILDLYGRELVVEPGRGGSARSPMGRTPVDAVHHRQRHASTGNAGPRDAPDPCGSRAEGDGREDSVVASD